MTWGGPVPEGPGALAGLLGALETAGATWAVCAPTYPADMRGVVDAVVEVARSRLRDGWGSGGGARVPSGFSFDELV